MKNVATFEIIGRVARIDAYDKVTRITTASNYNYKDGKTGEWREDTHWNQSWPIATDLIRSGPRRFDARDLR